jgi:hypothetical protein
MIGRAVMACKGPVPDILYGVAMNRAVMVYKGTETDILYGQKWYDGLTPLLM